MCKKIFIVFFLLPIICFSEPILVGIVGGSGSGKSTLAKAIEDILGDDVIVLRQDSYYKDLSHLEQHERDLVNFDEPKALDLDSLKNDLYLLKNYQAVQIPIYDFVTHTRKIETEKVSPKKIILIDGLFLFHHPGLRDLLDIKVYIDVEHDVRLSRRIQRDMEERGRSLNAILQQYFTTVKPMHNKFIEPSKVYADLIIPSGGKNITAQNILISRLKSLD